MLHVRLGFYYISLPYSAKQQREKTKMNKYIYVYIYIYVYEVLATKRTYSSKSFIRRNSVLLSVHFAQYKREGTYREILKGGVDLNFQDTFSMPLPLCLL